MPSAKPVALVTGGAKGIGRAIARHLLASGWRVAIADLPGAGLRRSYPPGNRSILAIEGDVRDEETVRRAVTAAIERFTRLDAVVSNAGITIRKPISRLTLAEWRRVIDTNLTRCAKRRGVRHHRLDAGSDVGAEHRILFSQQRR